MTSDANKTSNDYPPDLPGGMREKVDALERSMLHLEQVNCPIKNYFAPGLYAREISIPAGTTITGAIHKTDNLVVLSKGRILVAMPDGGKEISAPSTWICAAGMKNAVMALEDSVWTNFFPTTETRIDVLVELLTESKASELLGGSDNKQLLAQPGAKELEN